MHGLPHGTLQLVPHTPEWALLFAAEAERIRPTLGPRVSRIEHIGSMLAFQDLLRSRPDLARAYAQEKHRVAEQVQWDKSAYAEAKGPFIRDLIRTYLP